MTTAKKKPPIKDATERLGKVRRQLKARFAERSALVDGTLTALIARDIESTPSNISPLTWSAGVGWSWVFQRRAVSA